MSMRLVFGSVGLVGIIACGGGIAAVDPGVERLADRMLGAAQALEPAVTPLLRRVADDVGATLVKLEHRIKPRASLVRKIGAVLAAAPGLSVERVIVTDVLRYTLVIPDSPAGNHVLKAKAALSALEQAQHFVSYGKTYWEKGDPYSGTDVVMEAPDGSRWEIQLHTPRSSALNEKVTARFATMKDTRTAIEQRLALFEELSAAWDVLPAPKGSLDPAAFHRRVSVVQFPRPTDQ
ncbi:MAG: hypothetical protein ACI9WU_002385 [Myxococcota bacterium]|jgi:hypothetical protein